MPPRLAPASRTRNRLRLIVGLCALLTLASLCEAAPQPYTGTDYSGTYDCKGQDDHEGPYTGVVTLKLVRAQSTGAYGAYDFKLEVPGYGAYPGQAAGKGNTLAIHFALTDPSTQDYGTGIAELRRVKGPHGLKWAFRKYYYEPAFKGGNFGFEDCVQR